MTTLSTEADDDTEIHCHDCGMIASSPEEARSNGFCNVKAFDARRRVGGNEDLQRPTIRLREDGYYWLCPGCFDHMRVTLPVVVGGDLSDKFSQTQTRPRNGERRF